MTSQSPRIYTYKITFEEVPYYYYGVHKEKRFNEEYWGSPVTHKWCWEFYTPKKQILEFFDYTHDGWLEAQEVEGKIIRPFFNVDKWCLNENVSGIISTKMRKINGREGGIKTRANGSGIFSLTKEQRKQNSRTALLKHKENKTGIYSLTPEQIKENSKKSDKVNRKNGTGIYSIPKERLQEFAKNTNSQKWICLETGFITSPGSLSRYQKARGIDTSKRKKVS